MGSKPWRFRARAQRLAATLRSGRRAALPPTPQPSGVGGDSRQPLSSQPLLSVVVPVYQVEHYLAECLDSLLAQTYRRLEIVLVDDGSTDGSADILREYADRDDRLVVIRQENAGLGAARNTGLARCRGELVTFADSDDTVPPQAYQRMVRTLQLTGSDFVVGALARTGSSKVRRWVRREHARQRLSVTIDECPDMLVNVVACTKVFRRDFVREIGLTFPQGIRYEDQVPMTKAYLRARTFDVVPDVVYHWRARDDRSSITQQKAAIQDLVDRLATQREIAGILRDTASEAVLHRWYAKTLRYDFLGYLRIAADADDGYWRLLQESIVSIARRAPTDLDDEVELPVRVAMWLARHGHRDALRRMVGHEGFAGSDFPVTQRAGRLYADLDFLSRYSVDPPASLLRIRAVDQHVTPRLEGLDWTPDGRLVVRCLAVMPYVDPSRHPVTSSLELAGPGRLPPVVLATETVDDPMGNLAARRAHEDHTRSTLSAQVDLRSLAIASRRRDVTRWELRAAVSAFGVRAEAVMDARRENGSAVAATAVIADGALVTTRWSDQRGLLVEVHRRYAAVTRAELVDGAFELDVRAPRLGPLTRVIVGRFEVPATITPTADPATVTVRVATRRPRGAVLAGGFRVAGAESEAVPLRVVEDLEPGSVGDGQVCLTANPQGVLTAVPDRPCLLVDAAEVDGETLRLTGRAHRFLDGTAVLAGPRARSAPVDVQVVDGRFSVRLHLRHTSWDAAQTVLPSGPYVPLVESNERRVPVVAGGIFGSDAPVASGQGWSLLVAADRKVTLRRTRHVDQSVFSRSRQQSLRSTVYRGALSRGRQELAVFEAFGGTSTGDSPGSVCAALLRQGVELDLVWSVDDWSVAPPDGTRAVLRGTPQWYEAMGAARLLVNNGTFPEFFQKGDRQTYVQTWHGSPLKYIGTDVPPRLSNQHYVRRLLREAGTWDVLVSANPLSTRVFRDALDYDGRILEIGRPSNDLLLSPSGPDVRAAVRSGLGIPDEQTVVLYAPTWRDDARRGGSWRKVLYLDHERMTRARPDVTVLVRGHPNSITSPDVRSSERVVDVTSYPDITRLYLAADVLVTDYSAAMFDFALTDKRIVLLVPDLAAYRDRVRGLYLDLESMAPGPLVTTTDEVLSVLDEDSWGVARKQLRETYSPHDDGGVTDRLLDAVLERR